MKKHMFILITTILFSSCLKTDEDVAKIKQTENNNPPISSKDTLNYENLEKEGISNGVGILQVEEKIEASAKNPKTTTYDELTSNQNKKPDNTIYTKKETYIKRISSKTEQQNDSTLDKGLTKVKQVGKNGQREIVVEITYNDNKEIKRKTISDAIVTKPVNEIIIVGTKEEEITPTYQCPAGYDRNKPCDDRVYNSDLDTAY